MSETINKNSRVMYRNRVQDSAGPMRVAQVRNADYGREIKVRGTWWRESAFMPYSEWQAQQQPAPRESGGDQKGVTK